MRERSNCHECNDVPCRARQWWREETRRLLILALIVFSTRSSLADWNDVPSGSMRPTILEGDRVFVNKLAYRPEGALHDLAPRRMGQSAARRHCGLLSPHDGKRLVKRVVGLPGDTIALRSNGLVLNGQPVEYAPIPVELLRDLTPADRAGRVFAAERLPGQPHAVAGHPAAPARRDFGPYRVPEAHYFMMGDNRDDSLDSRYFGPVERKRIAGRAIAVVLSFDRKHNWFPRWQRFFTALDERQEPAAIQPAKIR